MSLTTFALSRTVSLTLRLAAFGVAATSGLACAHASDVIEAHDEGKGVAYTYAATEEQAWKACQTVMRWAGADSIEEHRPEGYMLGSVGADFVSYGTLLGAWIVPAGPGHEGVSVVTKRKVATQAVTAMSEETFHKDLAKALVYIQNGQPIPNKEP